MTDSCRIDWIRMYFALLTKYWTCLKILNLRPIDVFVTYDGKRAGDIAVSRYAVRHLVAGAVISPHIKIASNFADVICC